MKLKIKFNEKFSNKLDFLVRNFGVISQKDLDTDEEKYKEIIGEILKYSETKVYLQNLINITNF